MLPQLRNATINSNNNNLNDYYNHNEDSCSHNDT